MYETFSMNKIFRFTVSFKRKGGVKVRVVLDFCNVQTEILNYFNSVSRMTQYILGSWRMKKIYNLYKTFNVFYIKNNV